MNPCEAGRPLFATRAVVRGVNRCRFDVRRRHSSHSVTVSQSLSPSSVDLLGQQTPTRSFASGHPSPSLAPIPPSNAVLSRISSLGTGTPTIRYEEIFPLLKSELDTTSILRLFPSIIASIENRNIDHGRRLLRSYIPHVARHRMLALIPVIVDRVMEKVEENLAAGANNKEEMNLRAVEKLYDTIIYRLRRFLERPGQAGEKPYFEEGPLPLAIREEVLRLTRHLLNIIERVPSSSDLSQQLRLPSTMLNRLFSRRYLTPELRKTLLAYCHMRHIDISPHQWRHCLFSAYEEGNEQDMKMYKERFALAERDSGSDQANAKPALLQPECDEEGTDVAEAAANRERRRLASKAISELLVARCGQQWSETLQSLEQYLHPADSEPSMDSSSVEFYTPKAHHYAWSILLSRLGNNRSVDADSLAEMMEAMPEAAISGYTITPVMHGCMRRGEVMRAWEIWRDLVERERAAPPGFRGVYVDRVALAVASESCHAASNLDAAVALVDSWALRPWMSKADSLDLTHSLTLDAQNVNVLLHMCKKDGRPSIAFRLWAAALPRYGVYLDDISLNLLLDTARFADINHETNAPEDMFRSRLRQMAEEFGLRQASSGNDGGGPDTSFEAYDAAGFAKGSTAVLLDPPQYSWRDDHGSRKPWQMARDVFRQVILGNWPHLEDIKSPLEPHGHFSLSSLFGGGIPDPDDNSGPMIAQLPSPNAKYTHIIPTATTFQSYIALLGYYNLYSEIPLVLGWMKRLQIRPKWGTMVLALLHICENEGPRRWIRGWGEEGESALVRDEEILRRWLENWLGHGEEDDEWGGTRRVVPTEDDVAARRRWLAAKRERLTA